MAELTMSLTRTYDRIRTEPGLARNTVVVISLLIIAGVVGGIILANQRFTPPWSTRLVVYATFQAAPGISPGNGQEVRFAGVKVGDITAAGINRAGQPVLTLSIEPGHRLYKNATLVLRPKSPLNEMYVTIAPGGPPAEQVESGYTYPISNTARPVQTDEVLDHLDSNARAALTALLAESDVALSNTNTDLPAGLDATRMVGDQLRPVAEQLAIRKHLIRTLITDLALISRAVGGDDTRIASLAAGLRTTLGAVGGHQTQLDATLATLPGLISNVRRSSQSVRGLSDQLDPTLRDLQRASNELPDALARLRRTSDHIDKVSTQARPFLDAARPVVADLRPFTESLTEALPPLRDVTRELDPVTNALVPYLPDIAAFAINTRSITSTEDANGGVLRATIPSNVNSLPAIFGPNQGTKPIQPPGSMNAADSVASRRHMPSLK
jgi:phospholipid/cholesterol/gamma-HCH transport system substrate-binding protein